MKTVDFLKNWIETLHHELRESHKREQETQRLFTKTIEDLKTAQMQIQTLELRVRSLIEDDFK